MSVALVRPGKRLPRNQLADPLARALEDALQGGSHAPECPRFDHHSGSGRFGDRRRCACWVARSATVLAGYLRQEGLL